jgi:hypothetical protein
VGERRAERDALLLAACELVRPRMAALEQPHALEQLLGAAPALARLDASSAAPSSPASACR